MKNFFLLSLFSIFIFSKVNFSQEKIVEKTDIQGLYKLSDVVISATKNQTSTLELANSITVIDSAEIANRNSSNVFDLLKNEYGISFTSQGGAGTLSNISIRGGNSDYTLVLVDGIEVNLNSDPKNVYDFAFLSSENVHSIEILRGPQSTLYGSNSLAGVINIITKKGIGKPNFSLLADAGSYKTYATSLGMSGSLSDFNYSMTFRRSESEGFSSASDKYGNFEKDGYKKDKISARFGYDFGETAEINLFMNYNNSKSDYDQFGGKFGDDPTYIFNQEEFSFRGENKLNLFDGKWNSKIGASMFRNIRNYSYDTSAASIYDSKSLYDGKKYKLEWQNDFRLSDANLVTAGIEYEAEEAASEYFAKTFLFPPDYASIFPKQDTRTFGIYVQDQLKIGNSFFSTVGARFDNNDQSGYSFTYRIAPAYIIWTTQTKVKATFGTGFKTPSLFNLYDPAFGNPDLKPEKSVGFDVGIERYFLNESILFGVTYFQNDYKDLLGFDKSFRTININIAKTNGIEAYLTSRMSDKLEIKANYTFTRAKDESEGVSDRNRKLIRRPEHKTGLFVSYTINQNANINTELVYVGKREDIDFSTADRIELKDYFLLNLASHYQLLDWLRLNLRFENILDIDYEEVYGYATPGFSIYGGIKLSLNDI